MPQIQKDRLLPQRHREEDEGNKERQENKIIILSKIPKNLKTKAFEPDFVCMLLIQAPLRQQENLFSARAAWLHSYFQDSQGYVERCYLKKNEVKK